MSTSGFLRTLDEVLTNEREEREKKENEIEPIVDSTDEVVIVGDHEKPADDEETEEPQEEPVVADKEETEEPQEPKKGREKWNKAKLLKEKARDLERQNAELVEKLEAMDNQLRQVYDTNIVNYGSNVAANLDIATNAYKEALENGTTDDIITATANYTMAINEYQNAKKVVEDHKLVNENYAKNPKPEENRTVENYYEAAQSEWLRENPELDSSSRYYDAGLEKKIMIEADKLNSYLRNKNMEQLIGSPEYLDKLDEFIEYYKNDVPNKLQGYGVRTTNNTAGTNANVPVLTQAEKNMADAMSMSAQEFKASQARMPESLKMKQQSLRGR